MIFSASKVPSLRWIVPPGIVNVMLDQGELYAATKGEVFRLDPSTGRIRWKNRLPGMGFGLITVANAMNQQTIAIREKRRQDESNAAATGGAAAIS